MLSWFKNLSVGSLIYIAGPVPAVAANPHSCGKCLKKGVIARTSSSYREIAQLAGGS
jgi:hypothetical protein